MSHSLPLGAVTRNVAMAGDPPVLGHAENSAIVAEVLPREALPNPSLRLDASLGMVVIEFRDALGEVINSLPNQRLLDAYRSHTTPLPGAQDGQGGTAADLFA